MKRPNDGPVRRAFRAGAWAVTLLSAAWGVILLLTGGFDLRVLDIAVTSHEPFRPLLIAAVALTIFMIAGGDDEVRRRVSSAASAVWRGAVGRWHASQPFRRWLAQRWRAGHLDHAAAGILVATVSLVGIVDGSKALGGSDWYGYISEAELFLHGHLTVSQPWVQDVPWPDARATFSPLGYRPQPPATFTLWGYRPAHDPWAIVPTYSPGLPLLMAAAKFVAGNDALYWVVPLGGGLLVLSTYLLGQRLGSRRLGLAAAFLMATSPPFLTFQMVTMTDVPVAGVLALACWCALGRTMRSAFGGALALAIALLIRPNLAPIVPVLALWAGVRAIVHPAERWRYVVRGVVVLGGGAASVLITMLFYWLMYGSPTESGYGPTSGYFAIAHLLPNIRNYTQWFADAQTPWAYLGIAALFIPARWLWPRPAERSAVLAFGLIVLAVWAEFCAFLVFDGPSYLRYLISSYPFIMLGIASVAMAVARVRWRVCAFIAAAAVIALGCRGLDLAGEQALQEWPGESEYIAVAQFVRQATPENSVVFAMQHGGNIRYFGGRTTLRWDLLEPDWLDRSVAWMADHGVHSYVLVEDWEQDAMRKRFAGQTLAAVLDGPPVFRFGNKRFFDFGRPPGEVAAVKELHNPEVPRHSVPSEPLPSIVWKR